MMWLHMVAGKSELMMFSGDQLYRFYRLPLEILIYVIYDHRIQQREVHCKDPNQACNSNMNSFGDIINTINQAMHIQLLSTNYISSSFF